MSGIFKLLVRECSNHLGQFTLQLYMYFWLYFAVIACDCVVVIYVVHEVIYSGSPIPTSTRVKKTLSDVLTRMLWSS